MNVTETSLARQHMTPESNSLFRDATLSKRMGPGTIAGGLNDQVRFRFDKQGAPSEWGLIPDNKISAELLASESGPKLEQKIQTILTDFDSDAAKGNLVLNGIMLPDDEQSWAAGYQLMQRDYSRTTGSTMRPMSTQDAYDSAKVVANVAGAQSIFGWVQMAPDYSRNILTSIGAYSPSETELTARSGRLAGGYQGPIIRHELHHRVSEADFTSSKAQKEYAPYAWLEEGAATVLSMEGKANAKSIAAWGVSPQQHAGHVGAPDTVDLGWKPWQRDYSHMAKFSESSQANYVDSIGTLNGLFKLAGIDRRTNDGLQQVRDLLQAEVVQEVPENISRSILKNHGVRATPERVGTLSQLVLHANSESGLGQVQSYLDLVTK